MWEDHYPEHSDPNSDYYKQRNLERKERKDNEKWERLNKDRTLMGRLKMLDYALGGYRKHDSSPGKSKPEGNPLGVMSMILFLGGIAMAISLLISY